nr:DNA (cytosine-5-)-methyltransferase [Mycoplasma phocoeninasale]
MHDNLYNVTSQILEKYKLTNEKSINDFLKGKTFSLNSKKPSHVERKDLTFKKYLVAATLLQNNQVDITQLDSKIIDAKKIDLITYSFPCQGLSIANMGRAKGINDPKSTSSLVWQIYRVLKNANHKPKFLLMENVKNILSKKFLPEYNEWKKILRELGYKTFTTTLNGINHGSIQKRERVFALSVLENLKIPFSTDEEYKEKLNSIANKLNQVKIRNKLESIFKSSPVDEILDSLINATPSRIRMVKTAKNLNDNIKQERCVNTLTTKQDRIPNIGILDVNYSIANKLKYRFITPREAFMIMGFSSEDFDNIKTFHNLGILTKESLYRQAGNSIVVDVLKDVFVLIKEIYENNV